MIEGDGAEIRYLNFNLDLQEGRDEQKLAVRQAVAQVIDRDVDRRERLQRHRRAAVLDGPGGACSSTPRRSPTSTATAPDVDAATQTLEDAGVDTPVPLEVWWTPTHYGPASGDEYAEIKRQLDDSGLFDVTLKSTEWNQYSEAAFTDKYPAYQLGWFPDYPDADNYTSPVLRQGQLPQHPLRQPGDGEAARGGEGEHRRRRAREGVRRDPADRSRGRADHPLHRVHPDRRSRSTGSRAWRTRSTRRTSSATG